ncbi:GNAT family N-acetyltransferase [Pullulanibacillus sp. KACC 23026]|uniref:GNAT family N-acetyltransferase n=1 Tax=Pullulanibacillus sp. KACC 23026 TaxID=3028315 RepID=UPI0023AFF519|nr:GNAT family N-acetyltransferase [Pullulanibacillus sp. KACC 23026]WEG14432.1 GNAT family N-acetyltransferase [Pullulanibacillus sp. KACC 23026]
MFPTLETERLWLREIAKDDAEDLFACFSNERVMRFYGQETLERIEQAEAFVDFFAKNYKKKRGLRWGIEIKGTQGIIGTIGFNAWSPKHRRAEIGYEIHPEHWRKGYTFEAVSRVIQFGFNEFGLTRIGAIVFKENVASSQLLTKFGFQQEGILRDYIYQNGQVYDTNVYSILKNNR